MRWDVFDTVKRMEEVKAVRPEMEGYFASIGARKTTPSPWEGKASSKHCFFPVSRVQIQGQRRGSARFRDSWGGGDWLIMIVLGGGDVTTTGVRS